MASDQAESSAPKTTLKCPKCLLDIPVGAGGLANLNRNHIDKAACRETVRLAALPKKPKQKSGSIKSWLSSVPRKVASTVSAPRPVRGPIDPIIQNIDSETPSPLKEATGSDPLGDIDLDPPWTSAVSSKPIQPEIPSPCGLAQSLLRQLRAKSRTIPSDTPLASSDTPLAIFSIDPSSECTRRDLTADWGEYLYPMLRRSFVDGALGDYHPLEYAKMGKYGIEGFCRFFDIFIEQRGLRGHLIQEYFELLIKIIDLRFPLTNSASVRDGGKTVAPGQLYRTLPLPQENFPSDIELTVPCFGLEIRFPAGQSHHTQYPFGLHKQFVLPWDYYSRSERFYIQSKTCKRGLVAPGHGCSACEGLLLNDVLVGVLQRAAHGVHENTPLIYMPIGVLVTVLRRRIDQCRGLKLIKLNDTRKLLGVVAELEEHKQFVMAVGSGKVTRVAQLVKACINNQVGIRGMLERYYRACRVVYNPKSFDEDDKMLMLLVLRLGGARLAGIVHRALGLPGLSTIRSNTVIRPLRASPGYPTIQEIEANIDACAEGEPDSDGHSVVVHRVLMLDEIAVEQRPRWDDKTNKILGACRECCGKVSLELNTEADLQVFFDAVDSGEIHLASEATVAAFGALSRDPRIYSPRPCCISGTDKHEDSTCHAEFIQQIITAANNKRTRGDRTYRTICIASDGEARRGGSLVRLTMNRDLHRDSPIYPLLAPLELMNLRVGEDDLTADKDYRHVLKTFRNLLMRRKGTKALGILITPAVIKRHLLLAGHSQEQVNSYLNPNDKQDVILGYSLLQGLWSLPPAPANNPDFLHAREALQTVGQLGYHLLMPYIYIELSLHEQLVHLSTAAHLLLVLYGDDSAGTSFMANQTYVNLMIMIKNVFFCVAKTKIDTPDAEFFIILLGTDRLEVLFGLIRTAIGTDANVDILQLASRSSNLTEVALILANRPQWDRSPRRLKLPMIINAAGDISRNADHINPASWKGDVHVKDINLLTAWRQGRKKAEQLVPRGVGFLHRCAETPGIDIFSPLGESLVQYLEQPAPPEDFEIDPDLLPTTEPYSEPDEEEKEKTVSPSSSASLGVGGDSSYTPDGDVEDALAIAEPRGKSSPHMMVGGKKITKARALSGMMRFRGIRSSTDRLKRVAGLPSFSPTMNSVMMTSDSALGVPSIRIGNPVALLVSCEEQLFLAVAQVNDLSLASEHVQSISLDHLLDSSAKISVQVLRVVPSTVADDPTEKNDWCWSLKFEGLCSNVPGNLVHPLNPSVSVVNIGSPTYLFDSQTLLTAAASIHGQMVTRDFICVPKVRRSDTFPYRHGGRVCFIVEIDPAIRPAHGSAPKDRNICSQCKAILDGTNGQRVLEHMAGHLLFDSSILSHNEHCGLCLLPFPLCVFYFKKSRGTSAARQVDWEKSTCSNIDIHFNMQTASSSTAISPCSNFPVRCSLCEANSILVWTYHLPAHYAKAHNRTTGPYTYKRADTSDVEYIRGKAEEKELKIRFKARFDKQKVKATAKPKGHPKQTPLKDMISDAHSSSMALRNTTVEDTDEGLTDDPIGRVAAVSPTVPASRADTPTPPTSPSADLEARDEFEEFGFEIEDDLDLQLDPEAPQADANTGPDEEEPEVLPGPSPPGSGDFLAASMPVLDVEDWALPLVAVFRVLHLALSAGVTSRNCLPKTSVFNAHKTAGGLDLNILPFGAKGLARYGPLSPLDHPRPRDSEVRALVSEGFWMEMKLAMPHLYGMVLQLSGLLLS
ncbi:hypothetical protein B0H15DRAFT_988746 [Mycena belliarum]|uniref:Uncharacterized protein n=1 Tax=Mycena belliarum TaxID=1033014 RepID=A0AAD6U1K2_9AGAR|nr:hypothetical protein B0H15DRAFT_988746 [Mycena belliae]